MGLDRNTRFVLAGFSCPYANTILIFVSTPCGFCFVEYYTHAEALACLRYISGTKLDERIVRCDLDLGYREGRQFGRGKSGGQVSDPCTTAAVQYSTIQNRYETSTERTTMRDEVVGVHRHRDWRSRGDARLRSGMRMHKKVLALYQEVEETGRTLGRTPSNVVAHRTMKATPLVTCAHVWTTIHSGCDAVTRDTVCSVYYGCMIIDNGIYTCATPALVVSRQ